MLRIHEACRASTVWIASAAPSTAFEAISGACPVGLTPVSSSTCAVWRNFAWSSVVPLKSNDGFA